MRLATVFDQDYNEPRVVFELPGGQRVELRELFRARRSDGTTGADGTPESLHNMPVYFSDLLTAVQHLDDVVAAVRAWASDRAESASHQLIETGTLRMTRMPFCAPIPCPRTFRCFDAFEQHARLARQRLGLGTVLSEQWYSDPAFCFGNTGNLLGHGAAVCAPQACQELDFGLELGLIIGRGGQDIPADEAWNRVAGFTIINNFVARDFERRELALHSGPGKSRDFATAVGPYLVTLDSLRDRIDSQGRLHLNMIARVNGRELSRGNAAGMYFSWPRIVEYASRDVTLFPGDILSSGTAPNGCLLDLGLETTDGHWLRPGDVVELEVERLGILRNPIVGRSQRVDRHSESLGAATASV